VKRKIMFKSVSIKILFLITSWALLTVPLTRVSYAAHIVNKLTASDAVEFEAFGYSVAASGTVVVVGAYGDDNATGAAYVYRHNGISWIEEQKLTASDAAEGDEFGSAVSVSGDVIVIGADGNDGENDLASDSGSVYVYRYNGSSWAEEQKLTASDAAALDGFGHSVSVSGDVIVIGAWCNDDNGVQSGSAYAYRYFPLLAPGYRWAQEQKLTASDAASTDYFGISVSVNGDIIVIGSYYNDDGGRNSGSAYVYRYQGVFDLWLEEQKLTAGDDAAGDEYGGAVSVSGDVIVIGAWHDGDNGVKSGSAYVYRYNGVDAWIEEQKLSASNGSADDEFGSSVSVSGEVIVIGAYHNGENGAESGSAYMYRYNNGVDAWEEEQKLTASDIAAQDEFGGSVSVSGEVIVVGAECSDSAGPDSDSGAVYVYYPEINDSFQYGIERLCIEDAFSVEACDNFDDGIAWEHVEGTAIEAGDNVTLSDPGEIETLLYGNNIRVRQTSRISTSVESLQIVDGEGDFIVRSEWFEDVPELNHVIGMDFSVSTNDFVPTFHTGISALSGNDSENVEYFQMGIYNFNEAWADIFGIDPGVNVFFLHNAKLSDDFEIYTHVIDAEEITDNPLFMVEFEDDTNTFTASYSLDGAAPIYFLEPFYSDIDDTSIIYWSLHADAYYTLPICTDDCPDTDGDGISDYLEDMNHNGVVDAGETNPLIFDFDADGDGVADSIDDCPNDFDNDADSDGVCGDVDICPGGDDTIDTDADTIPDACDNCPNDFDNDADSDGVCGDVDICPGGDDTEDTDADTIPDACDNCTALSNDSQTDTDEDGLGDACDTDDDADGFSDVREDECGSDPTDSNSRCSVGLPFLMLLLVD
jgi:hypothetical protein